MTGIFISYRQEDAQPWAVLLHKELAAAFGDERVFLDMDNIHAGNWRVQIHAAIEQSRVFLIVMGRRWLSIKDEAGVRRLTLSDDVHKQEIALALSRQEVTVIPVRVEGIEMPRSEDLPTEIRALSDQQSRELSANNARREVDIKLLIKDIERITGLRKVSTSSESARGSRGLGSLWVSLKTSIRTIAAIMALSLVVWACFYVISPGDPLILTDTAVVVGACAVFVLSAKWIWANLYKGRDKQ